LVLGLHRCLLAFWALQLSEVSGHTAIASDQLIVVASLLRSGGNEFTNAGNYGNIRSCIRAFDQGQTGMSEHYGLSRRARPADACPSRCRPR